MKLIIINTKESYSSGKIANLYINGKKAELSVGDSLLGKNLVVEKINVDDENPSIVFRSASFDEYTLNKDKVLSIDLNYSNEEPLNIKEVLNGYDLPIESIIRTIDVYGGYTVVDGEIDMNELSNSINDTLDYNATITRYEDSLSVNIKSNR